jgi:hypothetical protein
MWPKKEMTRRLKAKPRKDQYSMEVSEGQVKGET